MYTPTLKVTNSMSIKSGENPNDKVSKESEASVITGMSEQDKATLKKIDGVPNKTLQACGEKEATGMEAYRLQQGEHGGSNVFFNRDGKDCRYSLTDGVHGSMYLALAPDTAMKEVFQNKKGLKESDLDDYFMGTVVLEKDVDVLQMTTLLKKSHLTLHDVTTATREVTQALAKKVHAAGFDGMMFPSNVTGEQCLVLWHDKPSGDGLVTTKSQKSLSEFKLNGRDAADVLVFDLNIPVEE